MLRSSNYIKRKFSVLYNSMYAKGWLHTLSRHLFNCIKSIIYYTKNFLNSYPRVCNENISKPLQWLRLLWLAMIRINLAISKGQAVDIKTEENSIRNHRYGLGYIGVLNYKWVILLIMLWAHSGYKLYAHPTYKIVATTSIIGDAIKNIVGDNAQVIKLMGPGVDPHSYKATPQNIQDLIRADIIFYNGLHLEGKMADILAKLSKRKPTFAASDGIDSTQYLGDFKYVDGLDPHIWFNVLLWKQAILHMSECLQKTDTISAAYYQENTKKYLKQLDELHENIQKSIQEIPKNQRVLITAHDAFTYFGRAYQIEVRGLQGISTVAECGLRDITELVDFIVKRKIKAIFPENSVPNKPLKAVIEGCKKRGHVVKLGQELYSDALGEEDTEQGTYIGMVRTNVKIIVDALK